MRYAVISLGLLVAACAASSPSLEPGPQLPASVQGTSTGLEVRLNRNDRAVSDVVCTGALEREIVRLVGDGADAT